MADTKKAPKTLDSTAPKVVAKTPAKKTPLKKTPLKKAPVKKAAAKKPAKPAAKVKAAKTKLVAKAKPTPKTPTSKKPAPKQPVLKKPAVRKPTAQKPATKASANKQAAPRKPAPKKPAPKASTPKTIPALHAKLEQVADKLSRADARHARRVKTLQTAMDALRTTALTETKADRTSMRRHIKQAEADLAMASADIRAQVRHDLKAALAADGAERMDAVLSGVETRLEDAERDSNARLARLSSQLAEIARATDARFARVEAAHIAGTDATAALSQRIDSVEADTAQGLGDIGDRMVELATSLRLDIENARATSPVLTEKLDAIGDRTSTEISAVRAALAAQVEATQRRSEVTRAELTESSSRQDTALAALTARLENLEYAVSQPIQAPVAPMNAPASVQHTPLQSNVVELSPAMAAPAPIATAPIAPAPIANARTDVIYEPADADGQSLNRPEHFPVEFVPGAPTSGAPASAAPSPTPYAPALGSAQLAEPLQMAAPIPQPAPQPMPVAAPAPANVPDFATLDSFNTPIAPAQFDPSIVPAIGDADLPYLNPGYAESGTHSGMVETGLRIGGSDAGSKSAVLSALKGRNVRITGAAIAVGLIGLVAMNSFRGTDDTPVAPPKFPASVEASELPAPPNPAAPQFAAPIGTPTQVVTTAPIGDTSALDVPLVDTSSAEGQSLMAAVEAGNPVAQYQMGLIRVEEGRVEDGIALVRRAADSGLPAAQYRLAKFYEQGEGVTQDYATASRLTELAARSGHRIAMHDIGLFHAEGLVTGTPDRISAIEWFDKASRMGVVDSQFNLAYLLDRGEAFGVTRDPVRAYAWYAIASRNGDQQAGERLESLRAELTSEQLTEAESRIASFRVQPMDESTNGIFRDLPWAPVQTAGLSRDNVRDVQSLLNQLGFDTGTPDGLAGAKTAEAIISYERSRALPETGRATAALLSALESDVGA